MKGLIDVYKIKDLHSGLGQFSLNFANHVVDLKTKEMEIDFLVPDKNSIHSLKPGSSIQYRTANVQKRYFPGLNPTYDFWHSLHQFPSFFPNKNTFWILTIHDLNFIIEKGGWKADRYLRMLQSNVNRADCITTTSEYSKAQIEKYLEVKGKNIRMIYNGVASDQDEASAKPAFVTDAPFFFSLGIFNAKKNFHTLLPVMKHFKDFQLILAGHFDTPYGNQIKEEIAKLHLQDRIILPGKISEADKYWLYHHCRAFLFPSLAEGFGMPVIEAMKAGKPVFLSTHTSLPEIGGPHAYYFENFDAEPMAQLIRGKLQEFYTDSARKQEELKSYSSRFEWKKCAGEYLRLYEEVEKTR